jgi:archaellum biogenesis ATPase FlaH
MKSVTDDMLQSLIQKLQSGRQPAPQANVINPMRIPGSPISIPMDNITKALMGGLQSPAESPTGVSNLNGALALLSSDVSYGTGRFYDSSGNSEPDYWLAGIWAIASLNWPSGKDIARNWSKQSGRYTDDGFEKAWNSYNPAHENGIGIGSLYKRAIELGWNQTISESTIGVSIQRFTLLGINDLAALPTTEHLVKGVLPSSGLAAIYGPSGSGKTFLALDLIMAIACQSDWFGHKVKNAPVIYVGLEGKGGINNRIQAWRIKNPKLTPTNFKIILDNFDLMKASNVTELAQVIVDAQMHQGVIVIDTLNQASPTADENSSQDMGVIIKHLKLLQESTGGLVLIIHHTGKNTSQGLRGHSSLKAALDANIEVIGGDKRSWLLEKSKDGEDGKSFAFRLEVQNLGTDSDGDPITSCTVERDHSA